jgi:hypothetical protein
MFVCKQCGCKREKTVTKPTLQPISSTMMTRQLWNSIIILVCIFALCGMAKKSAKDWSKIDYDAIDNEWMEGDEESELITEDEVNAE